LVDKDARTVTVPAKGGKCATVAVEDIRLAPPQESFANAVQSAIDAVDEVIEELVPGSANQPNERDDVDPQHHEDADFLDSNQSTLTKTAESSHANSPSANVRRGERVMIYWPVDDSQYASTVKHLHRDGEITVLYDDGEIERLNFDNEVWRYETSHDAVPASSGAVSGGAPKVIDAEPDVLEKMLHNFGNKTFFKHQAQGFEQFPLVKAYDAEEETFIETVKIFARDDVPDHANVINSHFLYKLKQEDDGTLKLKARIAPHGNEDDLKDVLRVENVQG